MRPEIPEPRSRSGMQTTRRGPPTAYAAVRRGGRKGSMRPEIDLGQTLRSTAPSEREVFSASRMGCTSSFRKRVTRLGARPM